MTVPEGLTDPGPEAWRALRHLLGGPPPARAVPRVDIATAARLGQVAGLALRADPELARHLESAVAGRSLQELCLVSAERRLARDLEAAGLHGWALLKGSATAHLLYEESADRERTDVDVLLADGQFDGALAALVSAGWEDATHPGLWADADAGRPWERTVVVDLAGVRVGADLHRRLVRWRQFTPDHEGVIARAAVHDPTGLRLAGLEDLLLHTAVHAANVAFDVPLRSYVDVQRLVAHPAVDWDRTVARAQRWGVQTALWATLRIARLWLGAGVPGAVETTLAPTRGVQRALTRALGGAGAVPTSDRLRGRLAYVVIPALVRRGARARAGFATEYARTRLSHAWVTARARRPG